MHVSASNGEKVFVMFNGQLAKSCLEANDEEGYIISMAPYTDSEPVTHGKKTPAYKVFGEVEIIKMKETIT